MTDKTLQRPCLSERQGRYFLSDFSQASVSSKTNGRIPQNKRTYSLKRTGVLSQTNGQIHPDTSSFSSFGFFRLRLRPVHQIQDLGSTGKGRIKPTVIIRSQHLLGHISLIQENPLPLSALSLMTGYRISIFYLQGIVMRVFLHLLHPLAFGRQIGVILQDGIKQLVVLFFRKRRGIRV